MMESELKLNYHLILPSEIPKSMIAKEFENQVNQFESKTMDNLDANKIIYNGLARLYEKYIDSSTAAMEVNISSSTKYDLINLFQNGFHGEIEIDKICTAMEIAVNEISFLMNDTASRFRRQSIFTEIIQSTNK